MKHFKFINYPQGCLKKLKTVYFGSGSWALDSTAKAISRQNAACFRDNPGIDIILEGHCDKEEYKGPASRIGQKRAEAVRDYLVQVGVDKNRLEIKDRGAAMPVDPGDGKDAFAKNRRVELIPELDPGDCNGEDACGRKEGGAGCENGETCQTGECSGCEQCDADDICIKKEDDCIPIDKCDNDDGCDDDDNGDCENCDTVDDGCPDCEEEDGCDLDELCDGCDNDEDFPIECGIMEIIPIPDCSGNETETPDNGGGGQSA